jgi:hypothetical protein
MLGRPGFPQGRVELGRGLHSHTFSALSVFASAFFSVFFTAALTVVTI